MKLIRYGRNVALPDGTLGKKHSNPALSCDAIFADAKEQGKTAMSGQFFVGMGSTVRLVYCQFRKTGGWTLLLKATAKGDTFKYSSKHWTSRSTLNNKDPNADADQDAKYEQFNTMELTHLSAVFLGSKITWEVGPFHPITALNLMSGIPVVLGDTDGSTDAPAIKFDKTYFSSAASGTYMINSQSDQGSVRFGYSWHSSSSDSIVAVSFCTSLPFVLLFRTLPACRKHMCLNV